MKEIDLALLIESACEVYGVSDEEYQSDFKYGDLPAARQAVCYILYLYDFRISEIAQLTGYSQPRVIQSIKRAISSRDFASDEKLNEIIEKLKG